MIISDLNHMETISNDTKIKGGIAFADASAKAYARGSFFAATDTSTKTFAVSYWFGSSAGSSSKSSSTAF